MRISHTLLRAAIALVAVLVIALAGGTWIASAQGTIPPPPAGPPGCTRTPRDLTDLTPVGDPVLDQNLNNWFWAFGEYDPCGFFGTCWGTVTVPLRTLEQCLAASGNLTVLCIGSHGDLTQTTVRNITVKPDGTTLTVEYYGMQDGHCGIFFAPPPAGALTGYVRPGIISGS